MKIRRQTLTGVNQDGQNKGTEALWDRFLIRVVSDCIRSEKTFYKMLRDRQPEKIAKSLTMQILQTAKRKGRKCILITFSVRANVLEMTEPKHWQKVKEFMKNVFTGGTDGEDMFCEVLKALNSERWSMADVLVISDFEFYLPTAATMKRIADEQQKGTRFYGLQIGQGYAGYNRILDRIWTI